MSLPVGSAVLTVMCGCDMIYWEWVTALKWGAMSITQWAEATLCQRACATDYIQMVMYTTGVVLRSQYSAAAHRHNCTAVKAQSKCSVIGDEPSIRISHTINLENKMWVGSGSSQSAHIPVMFWRPLKFSTRSFLQWLITILRPASVTLMHQQTANSSKCMHL